MSEGNLKALIAEGEAGGMEGPTAGSTPRQKDAVPHSAIRLPRAYAAQPLLSCPSRKCSPMPRPEFPYAGSRQYTSAHCVLPPMEAAKRCMVALPEVRAPSEETDNDIIDLDIRSCFNDDAKFMNLHSNRMCPAFAYDRQDE